MKVIDIDSHYIEPFDWLDQVDRPLADEVDWSHAIAVFATGAGADLFGAAPVEMQDRAVRELPAPIQKLVDAAKGLPREQIQKRLAINQFEMAPEPLYAAKDRLAKMDEQRIDVQMLVINNAGVTVSMISRRHPEHRQRIVSAYNTWATQNCDGHTDRLLPVTLTDLADVDWAIRELTRVRRAGSRAFLVSPNPVAGKVLSDPHFDRFWSACEDLGMLPYLHIGTGAGSFPKEYHASPVAGAVFWNQMHQPPEVFLTAMIQSGQLARHPKLRFLVAEYGIGWFPYFLMKADGALHLKAIEILGGGAWRLPRKPSEYAREQVLITPLRVSGRELPCLLPHPALAQQVERYRDDYWTASLDALVFSSDYPHDEGSPTAVDDWTANLERFGLADRPGFVEAFFGGTMAAALEAGA
jgi:predicted TIM-barrel fold metal-dependent hydrolase